MRKFIENDLLKVEIDTLGAEVKSVMNKENNREYMWYGNPVYWNRTSPVLFPFVGNVRGKKYYVNGKEYSMGQHGFARDMEFDCISQSNNEIWFLLTSTEETIAKYPYKFALSIGYELKDNEVIVKWKVENTDTKEMYFSIGAHPAFLCPPEGDKKGHYIVFFDEKDSLEYTKPNLEVGLAEHEAFTLPLENGDMVMDAHTFDIDTYIFENVKCKACGLKNPDGTKIVEVKFPDVPLFAVWSPSKEGSPFVCIEPWYGRCDAVDFEGDISERAFTNVLKPSAAFNGGYSMKFY